MDTSSDLLARDNLDVALENCYYMQNDSHLNSEQEKVRINDAVLTAIINEESSFFLEAPEGNSIYYKITVHLLRAKTSLEKYFLDPIMDSIR